MKAQIPPKRNRKEQRHYDKELYKLRHLVENALHLKRWRGIATRYAKCSASFLAAVHIRCIALWATTAPRYLVMSLTTNPFNPANDHAYRAWREQKLVAYPVSSDQLIVDIKNPAALTATELEALRACCRKTNMVI